MIKFHILTLFPELYPAALGSSIIGRAYKKYWDLDVVNIRDFAEDAHKSVDDTPSGGGAGMVLRADILGKAVDSVLEKAPNARKIYLSPRGTPFQQQMAKEFSKEQDIIILSGRYEGVDQRVLDYYNFDEISICDAVLTNGDIASYLLIDATVRLVKGVLGKEASHEDESFSGRYENLLEHNQYTRPNEWNKLNVPKVLRSGNHEAIRRFQISEAEAITQKNRPDLWGKYIKNNDLE